MMDRRQTTGMIRARRSTEPGAGLILRNKIN